MTARQEEIIQLIHKEVKPALGCTEPIAVALAVAKAVELIESKCNLCKAINWRLEEDFQIELHLSGNLIKNGMGVGIPGTGMVGLHIAAALGATCGKSKYGLEVLNDIDETSLSRAKELVAKKMTKVQVAKCSQKLYIKAIINTLSKHQASVVIADDHDKIIEAYLDAEQVLNTNKNTEDGQIVEKDNKDYGLSVKEIFDFSREVEYRDIQFILQHRKLNYALAKEGLQGNYGLSVGKTIKNTSEVFGKDFLSYAMGLTAAASDARMAGCTLPAMSNSGSGNQGITVSMPVIAYAKKYKKSDEQLARALIMSNLIAIHIKAYLGKLSALCGCVVASAASACGIVYLKDGNYEQVCAAIKNMIGNITGMVCDGAKVGCAMKVASGVSSAVQSAVLAMNNICISENDGIIDKDIEKTIQNLATIGSQGMASADEMILNIMTCK